ncbi:hypothetical protein ACI65C_002501 [Semiaphis heraclei]
MKIGSDVRVDSVVANYVFDCENFATCGALVRFRSGYESLKEKYKRNNLIKDGNDSLTSLNWSNQQNRQTPCLTKENRKSDDCTLVRRQHITDTNSFKHFNVNPTCTLLNIYNDYSYSNSYLIFDKTIRNGYDASTIEEIVTGQFTHWSCTQTQQQQDNKIK